MIIFHEGLPRSGKSYEATKEQILPALKSGRKVFARINGINHEKFAELAEITVERCHELLIHITEEQVPKIYDFVENDSLVIIDELQNFFPSGRQKLSEDMTKFVTEHGHRGLDIVCMGQSLADCHNIWRRRTQRKIQFLKLDMLGRSNSYKWTAYQGSNKADGDITFTKINSGTKKYDPAFFGAYASHQASTENKDNLEDKRLNIFSTPLFRFGLPAAFIAVVFAVIHLISFFETPEQQKETKPDHQQQTPSKQITAAPDDDKTQKPQKPKPEGYDFVMENSERYKPRLTYLSAYEKIVVDALVVWVDETDRIKDQLYKSDLIELGYKVTAASYGIKVQKGDYVELFRWMPQHDPFGAVPKQTQEKLQN